MMDFSAYLPRGKSHAIKAPELARRLGYSSERAMRKDIAEYRAAGGIICSTTKGGYYLPGSRMELIQFINQMEKHAASIYKSIRSARKELKQIEGQTSLNLTREGAKGGRQ